MTDSWLEDMCSAWILSIWPSSQFTVSVDTIESFPNVRWGNEVEASVFVALDIQLA